MSAQPSTPSNDNNINLNNWQELIKFTDQLLLKADIESQLAWIIHTFERLFSCQIDFWLADPDALLVRDEVLLNNNIHLSGRSFAMEQAIITKDIFTESKPGSNLNDISSVLALPLNFLGEIFGVIQLNRANLSGFSSIEIDFISALSRQLSFLLDWQQQKKICYELQSNIELISSITQISRSITSILDLENLINHVLSVIHKRFSFSQVNIYTILDNDPEALSCIGRSDQGIEPKRIVYYGRENSPISWAVLHQETVVINNISNEIRFSPTVFDSQTKSELVIPLISGDSLLGALDLCSEEVNAFGPNEVQSFQSLADSFAVAIRNSGLYNTEKLKRQTTERVQEIIGRVSADISLDDILDRLLLELTNLLPCDGAAIWLIDSTISDTGMDQFSSSLKLVSIRVKDQINDDESQARSANTIHLRDQLLRYEEEANNLLSSYPWLAEIVTSKQPLFHSTDSRFDPLGGAFYESEEYSALGIPLYIDDRNLGFIILVDQLLNPYTNESVLVASTFAHYASIAIENTRLYTVAHDQLWLSTVQLQVAEAIQTITSIDELLETIASMLADLAGANACQVYIWDQSEKVFFPQASYGFDSEQQERLNSWDVQTGTVNAFDQLLELQSPVILNSDTLSEDIKSLIFPTYNLQTDLLIIFPINSQDNMLGALLVDFTNTILEKKSSQKLWDDKYTLIQGVTHQAAIAIENLQRLRSREEEAYISIALLQVAQAIVSLNQLDEILGSIVRITPILVGVKRCIIYLWDDSGLVLNLSQHYGFSRNDLQTIGRVFRLDEFPFVETILERNQIGYIQLDPTRSPSDWIEIQPGDLHLIEGTPIDSEEQFYIKLDDKLLSDRARLLIGFPLSVKSEVLGVMLIEEEDLIRGAPSLHIREKRIEIVKGITQQAALAIKNEHLQQEAVNSERMERELQLAREIQATFLPDHLPEIPGWEMDIRWQPARQVGGDFYDVLLLDENRMGFVIADVADKGMPAALYMTLIRTLIRAAAKDNFSPAAVFRQVNELLIPDSKHGMFVTVFYAVFDLISGKVVYANAGHNPPIIKYLHSGELIELTRTTIALGIFSDIEIDEHEVTMDIGDWMLLYTDGVTEAFSANEEMYGTKRLFQILLKEQFTSPKELVETIEGSVHDFIDGLELSDDLTLAAIFRTTP